MTLPDLNFRITAQASTAQAFASTRQQVAGIRSDLAGLASGALAGFGVMAAVQGAEKVAEAVKGVVDRMRDLQNNADKIGITTTALQELTIAARQFQIGDDQLVKGVGEFAKRLGDAAAGGGELLPILKANGVALKDQNGHMIPVLTQLGRYADLVKNATSEQDRMLLVDKAFGKQGDDFVTFLSGGSRALEDYAEQAAKTGQVIDEKLVKEGAELAKRWDTFTGQMGTAWETLVLNIVDGVDKAIAALRKMPGGTSGAFFGGGNGTATPGALRGLPGPGGVSTEGSLGALAGGLANGPANTPADDMMAAGKKQLAAGLFDIQHAVDKPTVIPKSGADSADKKIQDVIAALKLEDANLTRTSRNVAIYNALSRAGTTADTERGRVIKDLAGKLYDDQQAQKALNEEMQFFGDIGYSAFDQLIQGGKSFKEVLKDILVQLAEASLKSALLGQGPLASLFGTAPTGGSSVGGLFGTIASAFTGGHAAGGFIPPGHWGIAGERGPEPVFGGKSGLTVVPNGAGGGAKPSRLDLHLNSDLLDARILRVSGPLAVEIYKNGQKISARRQELES